jgi:hypothetical protein
MDMLINLLLVEVISYLAATLSTSGVGSTPGKSTKNIGTLFELSSKASNTLNGDYSIYFSPIFSVTKLERADVTLSGLMVLNNKSLWNLEISLNALGKSAISAFSS